jgi:hypothetical protein
MILPEPCEELEDQQSSMELQAVPISEILSKYY